MDQLDTIVKTFHAYSAAFCNDPAAATLNAGGKVLLPQSFLQEVTRSKLVYPLQMLIQTRYRKAVYCGVLSFVAPEGQIIMPYWMLKHLQIEEGTVVQLQTCSLPKASIISLRPHQKLFTELHNPKAVLEASLKNHTCLTKGTTIAVEHVGNTFEIDVTEIKGAAGNDLKAVLVVDSDVKVEFERPLDMPPTPPRSPVQSPFNVANAAIVGGSNSSNAILSSASVVGGGGGLTFGGVDGSGYKPPYAAPPSSSEMPKMPTLPPKFSAFKGEGRNLKGEVIRNDAPPATASAASSSSAAAPVPSSTAATSSSSAGRTLGSSGSAPANPALAALQRRLAAAAAAPTTTATSSSAASSSAPSPPTAAAPPSAAAASAEGGSATATAAAPSFVPFGGAGRKLKD